MKDRTKEELRCFFNGAQRNDVSCHFMPKSLDGPYTYAHSDVRVRKELLGEDGICHIDPYLRENDGEFLSKHQDFVNMVDNGDFNPYKEYNLNKYYVKSGTFKKLDIVFSFKAQPNIKQNIIHIGEKGSGKTALQNCWLCENNEKLETNGIFWIRCDGHKLYRLWLNYYEALRAKDQSPDIARLVTLDKYLDIQLLYVFSKYCFSEDRHFFRSMIEKIEAQRPKYHYPVSRHDTEHTAE